MKIGLSRAKSPDKIDFTLITIIILMGITSLISIYSAFGVIGSEAGWDYLFKQAMWFGAGFIALGVLMYLGNDSILAFAKIAYWFLLGCLVVLLIGLIYNKVTNAYLPYIQPINGAVSWFVFPAIGSFQPSEFMKLALIIITAGIIDKHNKDKVFDSYEQDFKLMIEVGKWALPPMLLVLVQPDTGVVIITLLSLAVMIICSGIKKEWVIIVSIVLISALLLFFYMYFYHFDLLNSLIGGENGYKLKRITSWLNPEQEINGAGHQLYLSLLALGSAGINGHGAGLDLVTIPEAQTDFIFAIIGQSYGLIGTLFILALCLSLDLHICRIVSNSTNMFEKYMILGILGMLVYQQAQNIGMIVGLLPITGITLPLISYGGSSLLSYFLAFGIIMNASSKAKKLPDYIYE